MKTPKPTKQVSSHFTTLTLANIVQVIMHPAENLPMDLVYLCVTIAVLLALVFGVRLLQSPVDGREPPLVSPSIPVFGHVLGLLRYGVPYYAIATWVKRFLDCLPGITSLIGLIESCLSQKLTSSPIYTFDLYATKIHIVKTGKLVSAVQRNHKLISFDPFMTAAAKRMAGITGKGLKLLQEKRCGGDGINETIVNAMHSALLGPALDVMNQKMISGLYSSVDALWVNGESSLDLHAWCRHSITVASTRAVWGPKNPYESENLRSAF